jgi:hypothetical protein
LILFVSGLERLQCGCIVFQDYQYRNQKEEKKDFHACIPK